MQYVVEIVEQHPQEDSDDELKFVPVEQRRRVQQKWPLQLQQLQQQQQQQQALRMPALASRGEPGSAAASNMSSMSSTCSFSGDEYLQGGSGNASAMASQSSLTAVLPGGALSHRPFLPLAPIQRRKGQPERPASYPGGHQVVAAHGQRSAWGDSVCSDLAAPAYAGTMLPVADDEPTIESVSPACVFVPPSAAWQPVSIQLHLKGRKLTEPDTQILATLGGCSLPAEIIRADPPGPGGQQSVIISIGVVCTTGTLTLETHRAGLVSSCKTTLLVDHDLCCDELVGLAEQQMSVDDLQKCECFLQDVGAFLEYTSEVAHQQPSLSETMLTLNAIEAGKGKNEAAEEGKVGAAARGKDSAAVVCSAPGKLSEKEQQRHNELVIAQAFDRRHKSMMRAGLHLLEHSIYSGLPVLSSLFAEWLHAVHGLPLSRVMQGRSRGSLLHTAILSRQTTMVPLVLSWGDMYGHVWDWTNQVSVMLADGQFSPQTSALHLAACLGDGGSTAELLLLKYAEPRQLWLTLKDAQGATPLQYAMSSQIGHVNQLARALRDAGEEDSDASGADAMDDDQEDLMSSMQSEQTVHRGSMSSRGAARQQLMEQQRRSPAHRQLHASLSFQQGSAASAPAPAAATAAADARSGSAYGTSRSKSGPLRRFQDSLLIQAAWQRGTTSSRG